MSFDRSLISRPLIQRIAAIGLLVGFASARPVLAQSSGTPTDPNLLEKLSHRIDELEQKAKRVDELEAELKALKGSVSNAEPVASAPAASYPEVRLNILSDVTFHASSERSDKNTFAIGDIDPVVTAKLSENASVLGDFVIASNHDGFSFEIERFLLQYSMSDYCHIEAGRYHTAIGYYNNTYHNGTYFQTTTERPEIYLFEDGEGILPVHSNGISVNGDIPSGSLRLHYVAEIANGRPYSATGNPFRIDDENSFKAFNLALSAKPEGVPGLILGGSAYHDTVTADTLPRIDQLIFSAYVVYKTPSIEWLNEGVFMRDDVKDDRAYWTYSAYTQISEKFGKLRPYVRLQWRNSPAADPLLALINENTMLWGPTAGVRYDFVPMMALKAEYQHTERRSDSSFDELTFQWTSRF